MQTFRCPHCFEEFNIWTAEEEAEAKASGCRSMAEYRGRIAGRIAAQSDAGTPAAEGAGVI
jgi:hypothetical protein